MALVNLEIDKGVAFISLNRPEKYNSFTDAMALELIAHLDYCAGNTEVRCIYFTGSGKGFCAGQDLSVAQVPAQIDFKKIIEEYYNPIILKFREIEKPVVSAVNGVAAGAGANLALAGDIVVAAKSASFIQAFSKIGLVPDSGGTYFLPRVVGMQKATALMFLADKVSAQEAEAMGMIYKYFEDDVFETESKKIAYNLAQMPTVGLALTKKALNKSFSNSLNQQLELEKDLQIAAGKTEDFVEGVTAFLEKRQPAFKGK